MTNVTVTLNIPDEILDDIFQSAFDGDNPWFLDYEIKPEHYVVSHNPSCGLVDEECEALYLTRDQLARALQTWIEQTLSFEDGFPVIDSADADRALQKALFSEVVYA